MQEAQTNKYKGLIGTILFHSLFLLLLLFTGLTEPDPPLKEEGMPLQIRLGFDDAGFGETFENPAESATAQEQVAASASTPAPEYLTDEQSTAPAVVKSPKKTEEPPKQPTPEEIEAARQEIEAKKQQEHLKNLFNRTNKNPGQGAGGGSDGESGAQGRSYGSKYGGKTGGALPGGGSFVLGGRRLSSTPNIFDDSQDEGKVVVRIYVNQQGEVFRAEAGIKGSTTTSSILFKKAEQAALRTKFDADAEAPTEQVGTMTFVFVVGR